MKICFFAPANNYHTQKWCKWFYEHGYQVYVISLVPFEIENVKVYLLNTSAASNSKDLKKILYIKKVFELKKLIKLINPDIVSVHYASSYGALIAFTGIKNYILSMWGSDIYEFPQKSIFHKYILKYSLYKAPYLFSTSKAMATEASKYTSKNIWITPFGVDMNLFKKSLKKQSSDFIIGNIKSLSPVYGIDTLIKALFYIRKNRPDIPIKLKIGGKGDYEQEYKNLADTLGLNDSIEWLGYISQEEVASQWNSMDIGVILSRSESFGVSAIEALACSKPIVITDVDGLKEVSNPNISSLVVNIDDYEAAAESIIYFYDNPEKKVSMGNQGRLYVESHFEIEKCFKYIEKIFADISRSWD